MIRWCSFGQTWRWRWRWWWCWWCLWWSWWRWLGVVDGWAEKDSWKGCWSSYTPTKTIRSIISRETHSEDRAHGHGSKIRVLKMDMFTNQDLKTCVNPNPAISRPAAERIFRRAFWGASLGIKSRVHQSGRGLVSNTPARCWRTFYSRSLVPLGMPLVLKFGVREDNCHTQNIHHEQGSVDNTPCRAFNASHKSSIRTKVHTCPKRPQESQRLQDVLRCWLWSGPKFKFI